MWRWYIHRIVSTCLWKNVCMEVGLEVLQQQPLVLKEQAMILREKSQCHQFPGFIWEKSTSAAEAWVPKASEWHWNLIETAHCGLYRKGETLNLDLRPVQMFLWTWFQLLGCTFSQFKWLSLWHCRKGHNLGTAHQTPLSQTWNCKAEYDKLWFWVSPVLLLKISVSSTEVNTAAVPLFF